MTEKADSAVNVSNADNVVVHAGTTNNTVTNITNITVQKEGAMVHKLFLKAAKQGRAQVARKHLLDGAFVDHTDSTGKTAFDWAVINDSVELAQVLVEFEADLDDPTGVPFIDRALHAEKPGVTLFLLNQTDKVGQQIKTWLSNEKEEALGSLLSHSAELVNTLHSIASELKSSDPQTAATCLKLAARAGHAGASGHFSTMLLKSKLGNNAPTEGSWSPAHEAALAGDVSKLKQLKDVTSVDDKGNTPLHWAVLGGNAAAVETLVSKKANIEARNHSQNTPLHLAAAFNQVAVAKVLMGRGASRYAENNAGRNPLLIAIFNQHDQIIPLLVGEAGGSVMKTAGGKSLLEIAAANGKERSVNALLATGMKVDAGALVGAAGAGHANVVSKLLVMEQVSIISKVEALNEAAKNGQVEAMRVLLEGGAPADYEVLRHDSIGHLYRLTGLTIAVKKHAALCGELMDVKKDVYVKTLPPIYAAAENGHAKAVELLISHGAATEHGNWAAPIHEAAKGGHIDIVTLLLDHGVNINHQHKEDGQVWGYTPIQDAGAAGHVEVVKLLIERGAGLDLPSHYHGSRDSSSSYYLPVIIGCYAPLDRVQELYDLVTKAGATDPRHDLGYKIGESRVNYRLAKKK